MLDIKKERESRGMTQEEFADFLGVSRKTIVNYESGGNIPDTKEKMFTKILSNNTQFLTNKTTSPDPFPSDKEIAPEDINFVAKAMEESFDVLIKNKSFKREFVFRASEWVNRLLK